MPSYPWGTERYEREGRLELDAWKRRTGPVVEAQRAAGIPGHQIRAYEPDSPEGQQWLSGLMNDRRGANPYGQSKVDAFSGEMGDEAKQGVEDTHARKAR